jgi:hypothetical protein
MKNVTYTFIVLLSLVLISSCTIEKRKHLGGYHVEWAKIKEKRNDLGPIGTVDKEAKSDQANYHGLDDIVAFADKSFAIALEKQSYWNSSKASVIDNEVSKLDVPDLNPPDSCDNIILKNGNQIKGKIIEITSEEVKYHRCDNLKGPIYNTPKHYVFMLQYSNGTTDSFVDESTTSLKVDPKDKKRMDPLGIVGFCLTLASIPFWWFISAIIGFSAGIIGIVFGSISLSRILRKPETRGGLGFAIASLCIGIALVLATVIVWVTIL